MALDRTQRRIVDSLVASPQSVNQLIMSTGLSGTYLRANLKQMTRDKEILIDKTRQPYLYSVSPQSPELLFRRKVEKVKAQLKGEIETTDASIKRVMSHKKETWLDAAELFKIIAQAIEELDADGELIDTL